MATLTKGKTFTSGETVTPTKLHELVDLGTVTNIVDADISASAAIAASKLAGTLDLSSKTLTLPDSNVVTSKIADASVTAAKLDNVGQGAGNPPIYGCRAWVNFDGTRNATDTGASTNGANVKIRASGNVASVLKNGTGDYTVTFTTAMADAGFAFVASINSIATNNATVIAAKYATTTSSISFRIQSTANTNLSTYFDMSDVCVAIFR